MYGTVESLIELLSIPSVSGDKDNCAKALNYMLEKGEAFGFSCSKAADDRIGVIEIGEGDETVGILTHVDVAEPGNLRLWGSDPFVPVVNEGNIVARGAVDGKGPAIAALFAMKDVWNTYYHRGTPYRKKIRMLIGTHLENDYSDMKAYLADHMPPDYGFAPDGSFPICNVSKGTINVLISFPLKRDKGCIADIEAGTGINIVPERCVITLAEGKKFVAKGKAIDASIPQYGDNAVFKMAAALDSIIGNDRLVLKEDMVFKVIRKLRYGFDEFSGQRAGMPRSDGTLKGEPAGKNVFSPTKIYVENNRLFVNINGNFSGNTSEKSIVTAIEKYFDEENMRIDNIDSQPGVFVSRNEPFIGAFGDAYEHVTETKNGFALANGPSYAQMMENFVIWGPVFPGIEDKRRQPNESISVRELSIMESIYEKALHRIVFSDESFK